MITANSPFIPAYHGLCRPEIAALIPKTAAHILDLGCGSAALGAHIKARQPCSYHGIENNAAAAAIAKKQIDMVYAYSLEDFGKFGTNHDYDTIICADILEHLRNPKETLANFLPSLSKDGIIIASIPNIAHPSILADLSRGLFRYQNAGILDQTHIHHFTQISMFQMFSELNLKITRLIPSPSVDNPIQMLITAKKSPYYNATVAATIIIPSSLHGDLLRRTIDHIVATSDANVRIIAINNALPPNISSWIEQQDRVIEIRCPKNTGFTTGVNLGMEISNSPYTIICNDDIIVTPGWINHLIDAAETNQEIGIVGPMSNRVSGPQQDRSTIYKNEKELFDHALKVTKEGNGQITPFHRIVFFCTLIKKEVIDKIGYLDEIYSPGLFEDDDYCLRAIEAGFKCVIDKSTFIHHEGSKTTAANKEAYSALMQRNQTIFLSKWGSKLAKLLKPTL